MGKPEHTKRLLADTLRELLKTKRYAEITVADIVRECGVSRYTFYYHFKDKQDLVNWIYLDARSRAITVTNVDTVDGNIMRLQKLIEADEQLYMQVKQDDDNGEFEEYFTELSYHCFLNLLKSYLGDRTIDSEIFEFVARFFANAGSCAFWDRLSGKSKITNEKARELSTVIWKHGLYGAIDYYAESSKGKKQE